MGQRCWPEWVLDVTTDRPCFVPIQGDQVFWGICVITDRCPGLLMGLTSQRGIRHARRWEQANPEWALKYASAADMTGDLSLLEFSES